MLATPALAAIELDQSATFGVGAIVVDICQVTDAYGPYASGVSRRRMSLCSVARPASNAEPEPVTMITRAGDGTITALSLEF